MLIAAKLYVYIKPNFLKRHSILNIDMESDGPQLDSLPHQLAKHCHITIITLYYYNAHHKTYLLSFKNDKCVLSLINISKLNYKLDIALVPLVSLPSEVIKTKNWYNK